MAPAGLRLSVVVHMGTPRERRIVCRRVVTLIGSKPGCKVRLNHRKVAPVHLALVNEGSHIVAVDLIAKAGTLLNGLKLQHERLTHGDVLTVCKFDFRVEIEEPSIEGVADVHPFALDAAPHVAALEHVSTGQVLRPKRDVCIIGRRSGCDISLSSKRVSRVHALLLSYFGHPALFDLLSVNRTAVNDNDVSFCVLEKGDMVTIGEESFRVHFAEVPMGDGARKDGKASEPIIEISPEGTRSDLIDIHRTESSQRWRIADSAAKPPSKRSKSS